MRTYCHARQAVVPLLIFSAIDHRLSLCEVTVALSIDDPCPQQTNCGSTLDFGTLNFGGNFRQSLLHRKGSLKSRYTAT